LMDDTNRLNIIHQTGIKDEPEILKKYNSLKIIATAKAFFHDMPQLQGISDLVITRAGGIISELCIKGLPAILIPLPSAADDHQAFNAKALEKKGAAVMIKESELTGQTLKETMESLMENREKLDHMSKTIKRLAMPNADKKIANYILTNYILKAEDIKV